MSMQRKEVIGGAFLRDGRLERSGLLNRVFSPWVVKALSVREWWGVPNYPQKCSSFYCQ